MSKVIIQTEDYKAFIKDIKSRIQSAQIKAAVSVNREMLLLYWDLGQRMITKQQETSWGDGFIKQMSQDLKIEFPEMQGFSLSNLKYMRQWVQFWSSHPLFTQEPISQLGESGIELQIVDPANAESKSQQLVGQIVQIPWGQNLVILTKAQSHDEALFYV